MLDCNDDWRSCVKEKKPRKPQITISVENAVKYVYVAASELGGIHTTRVIAAGFLYLLSNPKIRDEALTTLSRFEREVLTFDDVAKYLNKTIGTDVQAGKLIAAREGAALLGDEKPSARKGRQGAA